MSGTAPLPDPELIYHDDSLLVVNKPAGLLAVPGRGADKQDSLSSRLQKDFPDALIVHRLDMATSGLMVFARGAEMQRCLSQMFREREVEKRYVAVVEGRVEPASTQSTPSLTLPQRERERSLLLPLKGESEARGLWEGGWCEIDLPLVGDWPNRPKQKIDHESGKPSLTRYRVLGYEESVRAELDGTTSHSTKPASGQVAGYVEAYVPPNHSPFDRLRVNGFEDSGITTRLELEPVTGRTHQLRVHLAAIGHPIIGDALYGGRAAECLMLHAQSLSFAHPLDGKLLSFTCEPPF